VLREAIKRNFYWVDLATRRVDPSTRWVDPSTRWVDPGGVELGGAYLDLASFSQVVRLLTCMPDKGTTQTHKPGDEP
jgi:hypothetical protein